MHPLDSTQLAACALCTASRLGDVWTTRVASPSLVNESNLIVKKLGWRFAAATLLLGLSPLLSLGGGMAVTVSSLLVCFSNAAKLLLYSQLGEQQVKNTRKEYLRKHGVGRTLV